MSILNTYQIFVQMSFITLFVSEVCLMLPVARSIGDVLAKVTNNKTDVADIREKMKIEGFPISGMLNYYYCRSFSVMFYF